MHRMKKFVPLVLSALCAFSSVATAQETTSEVLVSWRNGALSLTRDDFFTALATMPEKARVEIQRDMKKITKLLEDLKVFRTLAADARAAGLDKDPMIQKQMRFAVERTLAQIYVESSDRALKRPDFTKPARERYDINPRAFALPEQVRVAHVLVASRSRSEDEAAKLAEEVRKKALEGTDFAALAKEYSDDPGSKQNGGDLGFLPRGRLVKSFEDAAFAMNTAGEIGPVVKTGFGYHVIKFIARQPLQQRSFDELKDLLVQREEAQFVQNARAAYVRDIQSDKTTTLNTRAIDKLYVPTDSKTPGQNDKR